MPASAARFPHTWLPSSSDKGLLSMPLADYHRLALLTLQQSHGEEAERPPEHVAAELERLGLNPDEFFRAVLDFPGTFRRMVGPVAALARRAAECGRRWMHGVQRASRLFPGAAPPCSAS